MLVVWVWYVSGVDEQRGNVRGFGFVLRDHKTWKSYLFVHLRRKKKKKRFGQTSQDPACTKKDQLLGLLAMQRLDSSGRLSPGDCCDRFSHIVRMRVLNVLL